MILAVDPGVMTGYAYYDDMEQGMYPAPEPGELPHADFMKMVHEDVFEIDEVVCENFHIGAHTLKKTWQPASLHQIGALMYLTQHRNIAFTLQRPGDAKKFATDAKLKAAGFWCDAGAGHANDALRHLLMYLVRTQRFDTRLLLGAD